MLLFYSFTGCSLEEVGCTTLILHEDGPWKYKNATWESKCNFFFSEVSKIRSSRCYGIPPRHAVQYFFSKEMKEVADQVILKEPKEHGFHIQHIASLVYLSFFLLCSKRQPTESAVLRDFFCTPFYS